MCGECRWDYIERVSSQACRHAGIASRRECRKDYITTQGCKPPPESAWVMSFRPLSRFYFSMSCCECRWNYRFGISGSRVQIPPVLQKTVAQRIEHERFTTFVAAGHHPVFAVNADGSTGRRTQRKLRVLRTSAGRPGSNPGPAMDGGANLSSILVTALFFIRGTGCPSRTTPLKKSPAVCR